MKKLLIPLILWILGNLFFLTDYPFAHSDEPWLSGLTRTMMEEGSPAATEDFYDLYPRAPHAVKILFHLLQIPFIAALGYSLFSVRLLSLLAGAGTLLLIYKVLNNLYPEERQGVNLLLLLAMALDIQFIYASHFARQEIFLLLLLTAVLAVLSTEQLSSIKRGVLSGVLIAAAIGFHPNAFIIAWPGGLYILFRILKKESPLSEGLLFLGLSAAGALIIVAISVSFNPGFITDYQAYGEPLGVLDPPDMKLLKLPGFYKKLFLRIGGTYHTPPIALQMLLFPLLLFIDQWRNKNRIALIGFIGFNIGLLIIGKYSQPSISFLIPFFYIAAAGALRGRWKIITSITLCCATLIFTISDAFSEREKYTEVLDQLVESIPAGSIVLGNMHSEYVTGFEGQFYHWRNLHYLKENNQSISQYINERDIEYIILTDEVDYIYENRPYWNVLYGNVARWYVPMKVFLYEQATLISEFSSPAYAVRIAPYRYERDWKMRIYKVNQPLSISE